MLLIAKTKLNSIDALIFRVLIDSYISHDEFVLVNNVLKEYDNMKLFKSFKDKKGRMMLSLMFTICDSKKSKFIKEQEAIGLLSSLEIKTPLSHIPLAGHILL